MSLICTNSHYENHETFVPSINHNKDVALLSYVELYLCYVVLMLCGKKPIGCSVNMYFISQDE